MSERQREYLRAKAALIAALLDPSLTAWDIEKALLDFSKKRLEYID